MKVQKVGGNPTGDIKSWTTIVLHSSLHQIQEYKTVPKAMEHH
jgi:hypothetical protein